MGKVNEKQYKELVKLAKGCSKNDLKTVICDSGSCPLGVKECFYYYSGEQSDLCPVLIEVQKRLNDS